MSIAFHPQTVIGVAVFLSILEYFLIPYFGKIMKRIGFVGVDLHKSNKPKIPKGGLILSFFFLVFLGFLFLLTNEIRIAYIIIACVLFTVYGFTDDFLQVGKYKKSVLAIVAAVLTVVFSGLSGLQFILGVLFVIGVSNLINNFAGLNGLEIGCSTIIALFLTLILFMKENIISAYATLGIFLILVSFLIHNKYPARIFPGNTGTLLIGGFFASITLYYDAWLVLIPLMSLHIIDCILKVSTVGFYSSTEVKPTRIMKSGLLNPGKEYLSVAKLILNIKRFKENDIVNLIWFIQAGVGMITLSLLG